MKFLCLCYYDTEAFAKAAPEDLAKIPAACKPHDDRLRASGKLAAVGSFSFPEQWISLLPAGKETKGAYVPGPRQAGAFLIVEAKDMEEAKRIASLHPAANFGAELGFAVEVRPCERYEEIS